MTELLDAANKYGLSLLVSIAAMIWAGRVYIDNRDEARKERDNARADREKFIASLEKLTDTLAEGQKNSEVFRANMLNQMSAFNSKLELMSSDIEATKGSMKEVSTYINVIRKKKVN